VPDADRSLAGKTVVITAGGTREPIDPVRFIGNRSTGKQGIALAQAAANRGANVTLMSSNIDNSELEPIRNLATIIEVESAAQLQSAVEKAAAAADIVIMAAAVADFRPISVAESKVKKCLDRILTIELEENPDILKSLCANRKPGQVIVGFAAETGDNQNSVLDYGRKKAIAKGADLFAVNKVGHNVGFGTPDNEVWLLNKNGDQVGHAQGTKYQVAEAILSVAVQIAAIQTATIQL
jgi:phosphopantothenoylcysteine decarboxylase/phosphopantothenate--cysteine ligase